MNILLINIALRPESKVKLFPIGIGYIATAMKNAGFEFDFIDLDANRYSDKEVERLIQKKTYDVACMGCIVTGYSKVKNLAEMVRKYHKNAYIIVGNSVATSIYNILLSKTEADIAVMGEGDITIVDLLKTIDCGGDLKTVKGICYTKKNNIYCNPCREPIENISSLPHIDFSPFNIEEYIANAKEQISEDGININRNELRALPVNTARGCVANCTFCYHNFRGYNYRYRSMESILTEIREMITKYNLNYILFGDELTLFSRKRAEDFADAILESGLKFFWNVTCRADCFIKDSDLNILKKMKAAGCVSASFSLESSNAEILKAMNKHILVEDFSRTAELFHKAGITPSTSLVIGYPQETLLTIRDTFKCCAENRIYPSAGYLLPQPGSVMYEYAKEKNFIVDEEDYLLAMGDRQDLRLNMTNLSDQEMEEEVLAGLKYCNELLDIGLDQDHLIKTQYYRKAKK
ncbi:Radical SAM superfamily enzyme YgiQ, UPF0313 family [Propionispira arboris]|uniref:Radical SAM superfamily enzyme YgiQ, UPF0313 family n=1 Tax=Propionispira arboris TaxID=84035 RepID=A0A1H7CEK9_9FIRM|nr:radical SAM protein [Propionispira arboris]SEJ87896.1 Radical SAM superfamily enzyme YgiQ, UPF0313 family [Propionispira arboris]